MSKDGGALYPGIIVIAIGGFLAAIGAGLGGMAKDATEFAFLALTAPFVNVLAYSLSVACFHGLARLFGGKALFQEYYRVAAFASMVAWAQIVPVLGIIIGLWSIPVNLVILEKVHRLKRLEAVTVIVVMTGLITSLFFLAGFL